MKLDRCSPLDFWYNLLVNAELQAYATVAQTQESRKSSVSEDI